MTDEQLELAILRRYVEHHDFVGTKAHKCERELGMRQVISSITGAPADDETVKRWHVSLAPRRPYPKGALRPCTITTVNQGPHRFHARAFYEPGRPSTWDRIRELEKQQPAPLTIEKEKEQKFGILYSIGQAKVDFASYSFELCEEANIGVLFLDIDDFKACNERYTESVVDRDLLGPFQQLLHAACIHRAEAYRHGGEEFLILLPNHTPEEVKHFAERLRKRVETHEFPVNGNPDHITVSIGIALSPKHGRTLEELIERANEAEHKAKDKGKNRVACAT
jgi:diguanylate cyclase (GGDEF)-like protein